MHSFIVRQIFVGMIMIILLMPLFQMHYKMIPAKALVGAEARGKRPALTFQDFISGCFQGEYSKWFNQNLGLREYMIRTQNQLLYTVFNQASPSSNIIVGIEGQLYEWPYVNEYLFSSPTKIPDLEKKVLRIKNLQEGLRQRGVSFLLVITPSKAAVYPEYLPENYKSLSKKEKRDYDIFVKLLENNKINIVDGHRTTTKEKEESGYPMFCRGGTHWDDLAAFFTAQQILKEIGRTTGKRIVDINCEKVDLDYSPSVTDMDLARLLNVWETPLNYEVPHPVIINNDDGTRYKPDILIIGDSFNWHLLDIFKKNDVFSRLNFYYYYNTDYVYPDDIKRSIDRLNWNEEVFKKDVIILSVNEHAVSKTGFGFIEDALVKLNTTAEVDFDFKNSQYVDEFKIDGKKAYHLKKLAPSGTLFLTADNLDLDPNEEYVVSYSAKGFKRLNCDLFPDDLPQYVNNNITEQFVEYSSVLKSESENIQNCKLRFFIDGIDYTNKDTILYNVQFYKKTKH